MKIKNKKLKIGIQKSGKLTEPSIEYLKSNGIEFDVLGRSVICDSKTDNSQIILLRDDDIPLLVSEGYLDIGIVGKDIYTESGAQSNILEELEFGFCELKLAVPYSTTFSNFEDLTGRTIATKYPRLLQVYLNKERINAKCTKLNGSIEMAPKIGLADAIVDLVTTGNTLKANALKPIQTIFKSNAVLIANSNFYNKNV